MLEKYYVIDKLLRNIHFLVSNSSSVTPFWYLKVVQLVKELKLLEIYYYVRQTDYVILN